jgi:hypothetical protein
MSTGDFDRDLELALQASAVEAEASASLLLDYQRFKSRRSVPERQDKHASSTCTDGTLYQIGTLNQFHSSMQQISREFDGPSAICGYLVCAHVRIMEEYLSDKHGELTLSNIQDICDLLTDTSRVEPELRKAFTHIQDSRRAFAMSVNASQPALSSALRQWVANYEIGDFLSIYCRSVRTHFVRLNQWPARESASADVRQYLHEEERFGGRMLDDGRIAYGDHDSVFFFQSFRPQPAFLSPEEWGRAASAARTVDPRILVLDLNGHFAIAVACRLQQQQTAPAAAAGESGEPSLLLFNTTSTDYLDDAQVACAYDAVFPLP